MYKISMISSSKHSRHILFHYTIVIQHWALQYKTQLHHISNGMDDKLIIEHYKIFISYHGNPLTLLTRQQIHKSTSNNNDITPNYKGSIFHNIHQSSPQIFLTSITSTPSSLQHPHLMQCQQQSREFQWLDDD